MRDKNKYSNNLYGHSEYISIDDVAEVFVCKQHSYVIREKESPNLITHKMLTSHN